jgi:Tol biopolymer transport system component
LAVAVWVGTPGRAEAQYFGRNKIQYRTFNFKVLKTAHFDIYYYDEEADAAQVAGRMAERWYERLSRIFDHQLSSRQPLILYAAHPHFEQTSAIPGELGEGTGGVTEGSKRRIVLPLAGTLQETDHVIGHELVHAFQYDISRRSSTQGGASAVAQLPLWFIEGMAEYLSIGAVDPNTAMWMRDAVRSNRIPTIQQLGGARFFPYRYGQALWAYIGGRFGDHAVAEILKAAPRAGGAENAIRSVTGEGPDTLSREWHASLREWYAPIAQRTQAPSAISRRIVPGSEFTRYNVGPALSPDGRWLVFLSERDQLSIEMFLADAKTGKIVRRLTRAALDPHLQSLQFIQSAGSFSPDGRQIAYASIENGQPALEFYELDRKKVTRRIRFRELDEVFHPTWSPDQRQIAFSAHVGGYTDLYVVDVASGKTRRLTNDSYGDLEPAWSPDGKQIAFVTDRFTTDLGDLAFHGTTLALIDAEGGTPTRIPGFEDALHVDPQWTPDGSGLYFVSDHGGIPNVYRVTIATGSIAQLTNVPTGISGITPLSPAIAAARSADKLVMSTYEKGSYHLDVIESQQALAGGPVGRASHDTTASLALRDTTAATLPPENRREPLVQELVGQPRLGLVTPDSFRVTRYHPRFSLEQVSGVSAGVAVGGGSVAAGGGASFLWSDMLGDHNLVTFIQMDNAGGRFIDNLAAGVGYWNGRRRWNWGIEVSQVPLITRDIVIDYGTINGQPVVRQLDYRQFQIERDATLNTSYPFNRLQRLELSAGVRSIDFKGEVEQQIFNQDTGELIDDSVLPLPDDSIPTLNLGIASVALVFDNSFFGGTSPVLGRRYRLEANPVLGSLQFTNVTLDYRQYQPLIRPFVLAGRVMHYGRYGHDSEAPVLSDLFVGYPWLIRGYDSDSFTPDECDGPNCAAFNRLLGSRIALGNFELRLPVTGPLGIIRSYAMPPLELAAFYDVGAAWRNGEKFPFASGGRRPVSSHGVTARINLFGLVLESNYVHPDDRPLKGWYWQINLQPGF